MLLSEGQMSDFKGAGLMIDALPKAKALLGDKGYDADWFRQALAKRNIAVWRDDLDERRASIRMRTDCRGRWLMPGVIDAGKFYVSF